MRIVIKLGGSVAINEMGINSRYFSRFLPVLKRVEEKNDVSLCIGGGQIVRNYFAAAKKLGLSNNDMELVGIDIIKSHVRFVALLTKKKPVFSLDDMGSGNMVIGGLEPGRSTDSSAALLASMINAGMLVKMTNVAGICDKDPKKYGDAKLLKELSFDELKKFSVNGSPGNYGILDRAAIDMIVKNRIKTLIIDGRNPKNLIRGLAFRTGTIIKETSQ